MLFDTFILFFNIFCIRFAYLCGFGLYCVAARVSSGSEVQCDVADALVGYRCRYVVAGASPSAADGPRACGGGHAAPWPGTVTPALSERSTQRRNNWTFPLAVSFPFYIRRADIEIAFNVSLCIFKKIYLMLRALLQLNKVSIFDLFEIYFLIEQRVN